MNHGKAYFMSSLYLLFSVKCKHLMIVLERRNKISLKLLEYRYVYFGTSHAFLDLLGTWWNTTLAAERTELFELIPWYVPCVMWLAFFWQSTGFFWKPTIPKWHEWKWFCFSGWLLWRFSFSQILESFSVEIFSERNKQIILKCEN